MPTKYHTFEQPLNERMRIFMRIETLMSRYHYFLNLKADWSTYSALLGILEITSLIERGDLKQDLMKELERQNTALKALATHQGVDKPKLDLILNQQKDALQRIHRLDGKLGEHLKRVEFLQAIRQRTSIPGGSCDFDLPQLRFWLNQGYEKRTKDLAHWVEPYTELENAIALILSVIRDSASSNPELAENGFFQQTLDAHHANQLLRISIPSDENLYPEISAGKHRYSIRFMNPGSFDNMPTQFKEDVTFLLSRCSI